MHARGNTQKFLSLPHGVCISMVHDSYLFGGLTSSRSTLHLCESGIVHYADALMALRNCISVEEH